MMSLNKVYVVTSYPKGTTSVGDRRAGFINSIWDNNEKAQKERHTRVNRIKISNKWVMDRNEIKFVSPLHP